MKPTRRSLLAAIPCAPALKWMRFEPPALPAEPPISLAGVYTRFAEAMIHSPLPAWYKPSAWGVAQPNQ